jgi:hypothetical protein
MDNLWLFCAAADERTAKNQRRLTPRDARKFGAASLLAAACLAAPTRLWADPTLPTIGAGDYNVTVSNAAIDGGAIASGDGSTDDTPVIQAYINYAAANGGGVVEIPSAAGAFMSNQLTLGNNVNLQIDEGATLQNLSPLNTFISTSGISDPHDMEISGGGTIDNHDVTATVSSNDMLSLLNVTDLEVTGVTIANAAHEHLVTENDDNVTIDNITIQDALQVQDVGTYLKNTDGIDFSGSNFLIENSTISDGDDDIVAKPESIATSNVLITGDTMLAGHGVSIGGQTGAGLTNMTVNNCTFNDTTAGIVLKAGRGNGGLVQNVSYTTIVMNDVATPIDVSSYYINGGDHTGLLEDQHEPANLVASYGGNTSAAAPVIADAPQTFVAGSASAGGTPQWQNISISGLTVNGANSGSVFNGTPDGPNALITGIQLSNINYTTAPTNGLSFMNTGSIALSGGFNLPIQDATAGDISLSGSNVGNSSLTQNYSSTLATQATALQQANTPNPTLYNYNPSFNPASINTVACSTLTLGGNPNSYGTYNLNGGTLQVGSVETIGYQGTGALNQVGGTNNTEILYIGEAGGSGTYNMNGGTFNASIGISSAGTIAISNGAVMNANGLFTTTNTTTTVQDSTLAIGDTFSNTGIDGLVQIEGASTFDVANVTAIQGSGAIVMSGTPTVHTGNYEMELDVDANTTVTKAGSDSLTIAGAQSWGSGSELNLTDGTTFIRSNPGGNVDVEVTGAALHFQFPAGSSGQAVYTVGALNLHNGGTAVVDPSNGGPILTLATGTITIDNDPGQLDLNDGMLIVENPSNTDHGVSELASLAGYAAMGYNGGGWNGSGLMSSIAAADPHHATGIGILNNDTGNGTAFDQSFGGETVNAQAILARETYYGDALLSGSVDLNDFNLYLEGLNGSEPATWEYGDYTYSGHVDVATDFRLFAEGYYAYGGDLNALSDAVASSDMTDTQQALAQEIIISVVPEPSSIALLAGASMLLARRRRRRPGKPSVVR